MDPEFRPNILPIRVLMDEFDPKPTSDFDYISSKIAGIIIGSNPKFTIGIYGEWGTGKTTLMKAIENKLNSYDEGIPTAWFNAWRFEREEVNATIPLLLTIMNAMEKQLEKEQVKLKQENNISTAKKIKDKLSALRRYRNMFSGSFQIGIQGIATGTLNVDPKNIQEVESRSDKLKKQKPTVQEGVELIEEAKSEIKLSLPNDLKLVVFIDDLDRCSPKKALEVFESIKILLSIEGLIYVVGLSHETIDKLITAEYKESGIRGRDYIRKIIQIPIRVPLWQPTDITELMQQNILLELDDKYNKFIRGKEELISVALESNPREVKRFINTLVLAIELYGQREEIDEEALLIIELIRSRWTEFYNIFSADEEFRQSVKELLELPESQRREKVINLQTKGDKLTDGERNVLNVDRELWKFLSRTQKVLFSIEKWDNYRRVLTISKSSEDLLTISMSSEDLAREARKHWETLQNDFDRWVRKAEKQVKNFSDEHEEHFNNEKQEANEFPIDYAQTINCSKCGHRYPERKYAFCPHCGTILPISQNPKT